ncbi:MAG: dynamin family protein [Clostridiales bacterium]|nr:dynamin family protein [Clostridiales bacterium]
MFEKLNFSLNRVYPTLVVSTMSSGKSTLINALVGQDLLPSRNRACTAKAVAILDNDMKSEFVIHAVDRDGKYSLLEKATKKIIADFNQTNDVQEMIIEGEIKGIRNSKKSLLLIDTPGINNSMDLAHEQVTKSVLDEYPEGLILYVINAQQIGTYDDCNFLSMIAKKLRDNPNFNILFAINKMDLIDPEKERPEDLVENCKNYIQARGIENPVLIPISAGSALLFKKVLNGDGLSELEEENFVRDYKYFRREGFSLVDYVSFPERGNGMELIEIDGNQYTRSAIYAALENTGLPALENKIDEILVRNAKMRAPRITQRRQTKPKSGSGSKKGINKKTKRKSTKRR